MSSHDEIDRLLKGLNAFIAGGQSEAMIAAAESELGLSFPASFREYLLRWGNLSFDGYEYYGLTQSSDFKKAGVPNCVWFTLRKRADVGLPHSLVVFRNDNDEEYVCIDSEPQGEERIVIWDNVGRCVSESFSMSMLDYLREELSEWAGHS